MGCAICGASYAEAAHVKPRAEFNDAEDDRLWNIIPLCPSHHEAFDRGKIGIFPDKRHFLIEDDGGSLQIVCAKEKLENVRDEYVEFRNLTCSSPKLLFRLGLIPGAKHGSWEERALNCHH